MKFLSTSSPHPADIILTGIYVLITVAIICNLPDMSAMQKYNYINSYVLVTIISIYCIFYRSLRNLYLFLVWILIAFTHFWIYHHFDLKTITPMWVNDFHGKLLNFTLLFLLTIQALRYSFLKQFNRDLEAIFFHRYVLFSNTVPDRVEYIGFTVYVAVIVILGTITKYY